MPERKSFLLRVDAGLWAELEAWAQDELRSVNGQIEYLLRDAIQKRRRGGAGPAPTSPPQSDSTPKKTPRR